VLRVSVESAPGERRDFEFRESFRIGRIDECGLCIRNEYVSRNHAEVVFENGQWCIRDLGSANGIFVGVERTQAVPIGPKTTVRLGIEGPLLTFEVEQPRSTAAAAPGSETVVARYVDRYFSNSPGEGPVGEHTMMVRRAFSRVQKKQKRKYGIILAALGVLVVAITGYALYERHQASKQKAIAQELFYAMKSLDVDIANVEKLVMDSGSEQGREQIQKYRSRRQAMEKNYERFLTAMRVYDPRLTPQQRLLMRVTRIFGECELTIPADFESEINSYIQKWRGSGRLARAIKRAQESNYTPAISSVLLEHGLPPQFFYLALQESDFDPYISGPMTRKGIAKGMWQFIPETGLKYGLQMGPLVDLRRPDPADDRHNWEKATRAAAAYMKDLYATDAQASGLLVMACYNWGEHQVLPLVRSLPANPRQRNFWELLSKYKEKLPKETYDYVFYIVSAAVIGEDPKLFGFDFENPLTHLEAK
jgi:pSer/pThr/pTyr-binding forkhead associated (FHA) protein